MPGLTAAEYLRDPYYAAALSFANQLRYEDQLDPLLLLPRAEGCRCPLERAVPQMLAMRHDHAWLFDTVGRLRVNASAAVQRFVADFDHGRYPDLLPLPGVECPASSHRPACAQSAIARVLSSTSV